MFLITSYLLQIRHFTFSHQITNHLALSRHSEISKNCATVDSSFQRSNLTLSRSSRLANPTTIIPFSTNCLAVSWPIPEEAPVTMATFPAHLSISVAESVVSSSSGSCSNSIAGRVAAETDVCNRRCPGNDWLGCSITADSDTVLIDFT